jgi:hypothetical protein
MKALLRVKLDVSLPSNSEGVDEEQETRQLDKAARTPPPPPPLVFWTTCPEIPA